MTFLYSSLISTNLFCKRGLCASFFLYHFPSFLTPPFIRLPCADCDSLLEFNLLFVHSITLYPFHISPLFQYTILFWYTLWHVSLLDSHRVYCFLPRFSHDLISVPAPSSTISFLKMVIVKLWLDKTSDASQ